VVQFRNIIKELSAKGKTVFFSSHILDEVKHVCGTIGIISKGKLIAKGTPDEVRHMMHKDEYITIFVRVNGSMPRPVRSPYSTARLYFCRSHREQKKAATSRNAVTISTVHQAKGLEWPVVFIPGVTEARWPIPWGDIEDEIRCFYVAVTRARDECWVSYYELGDGPSFLGHVTQFADLTLSPEGPRTTLAPGQLALVSSNP
jgi:hypothetical protein